MARQEASEYDTYIPYEEMCVAINKGNQEA
jgi:hypothetical protein